MKDIVLSASGRFYPLVVSVRDALESAGLSVLTPDLDCVTKNVSPDEKHRLTIEFLAKISESRVVCVITDESGYVGRSVSMEIGFSVAKGKPLVCLHRLEDPALNGLCVQLPSVEALVAYTTAIS